MKQSNDLVFLQNAEYRLVVQFFCDIKRIHAIAVYRARIGSACQQMLYAERITTLYANMQCRIAIGICAFQIVTFRQQGIDNVRTPIDGSNHYWAEPQFILAVVERPGG